MFYIPIYRTFITKVLREQNNGISINMNYLDTCQSLSSKHWQQYVDTHCTVTTTAMCLCVILIIDKSVSISWLETVRSIQLTITKLCLFLGVLSSGTNLRIAGNWQGSSKISRICNSFPWNFYPTFITLLTQWFHWKTGKWVEEVFQAEKRNRERVCTKTHQATEILYSKTKERCERGGLLQSGIQVGKNFIFLDNI